MIKALFSLFLLALLLNASNVTGQTNTEKNKLKLSVGATINVQDIFDSYQEQWGPSFQLDYQRRISNNIYGGMKVNYFRLNKEYFLLFAPSLYTTIINNDKYNLVISSSLGYSIGDFT